MCESVGIDKVKERTTGRWGDRPEVEFDDEVWRCVDCGEEWYDPGMADRHTIQLLKATLAAAETALASAREECETWKWRHEQDTSAAASLVPEESRTDFRLAAELLDTMHWIAQRHFVGADEHFDRLTRIAKHLRGERDGRPLDARQLIRNDAACAAVAALVQQESAEAIASLQREHAALLADKERLDWLQRTFRDDLGQPGYEWAWACHAHCLETFMPDDLLPEHITDVREAIDAARAPRP